MNRGPSLLERLWSPRGPDGVDARVLSVVLAPAEWAYRGLVAARNGARGLGPWRPARVSTAVIAVGGIEAGGVGKTPLVATLATLARGVGLPTAVLSRGYGGTVGRGAERVPHPAPRDATQRYGDEPVLLAELLGPHGVAIWVGSDRHRTARAATAEGARLLLLDDGFQQRALALDASVVCLNGAAPLANQRLLPRGPLREPPSALRRATRVVLVDPPPGSDLAALHVLTDAPVSICRGVPALTTLRGRPADRGESVVLAAGIAHPERLEAALLALGHPVAVALFRPDHHRWAGDDLSRLPAQAAGLPVVVTRKDWVKLRELPVLPERLTLLERSLVWEGEEPAWADWLLRYANEKAPR
ncbi:MAG: tetraacyldisaccharide 4'-kinase [Candidatus Eisenbacteria bacterium]|nr:tetraacyldisaccharide 4'-kinase [Candidatus Eisenbacteria bacterium]MCC7141243.1 tetraacyldisaccharide 4'-kinase [Candidatus Eisenbacteria bacterium]